jgi:hypothetical protein
VVAVEAVGKLAIEGAGVVQAWSLSLGSTGCTIVATTTDGTDVPENSFFKVAQIARNAADLGLDSGTVSAVVLPFFPLTVFGSEGSPHDILRVMVQARVPAAGCVECKLLYVNGLRGLGQPVPNVVTVNGRSVAPLLCERTIQVCAE